jgi:hypothetical protein
MYPTTRVQALIKPSEVFLGVRDIVAGLCRTIDHWAIKGLEKKGPTRDEQALVDSDDSWLRGPILNGRPSGYEIKSKTISRLSGVASEGTRAAFAFLLVPNPVPKLTLPERPSAGNRCAPARRGNEGGGQRGIGISLFCQSRSLQLKRCLLIQSGWPLYGRKERSEDRNHRSRQYR